LIGRRKTAATLFDVGNVWSFAPDPKTFHGQLALVSDNLFDDDRFAYLYAKRLGRPSVPPSQLALILLMQNYERLSDAEAIRHTACDLNWAAVLRRHAGIPLCAESTLQLFRAHLILHDAFTALLQSSLETARKSGLLKGQHLRSAVDTKPMLGRGAVEDTYNLVATGMRQLARAVAQHRKTDVSVFLSDHGLDRLAAPSIKGAADIDWSNESAREEVLTGLVADAKKLMALADGSVPRIKEAAELLESVMLQDIVERPDETGGAKAKLVTGTAKGRIPSATDPEQRHGRKSAKKRFTGSKASVAADVETGLILAVDVIPGDCGDATGALELVKAAEVNSGSTVTEVLADCAYGGGATRQEFADAGLDLIAKVPSTPVGELFPKSGFHIELPLEGQPLEFARVTCPDGAVSDRLSDEPDGGVTFYFDEHCAGCSLRAQCTTSRYGRSLHLHAQERLIQAARELQATQDGRAKLRDRLIVENALARLANYGIAQARYVGHAKTRFQLSMAATVANFRRVWNATAGQGTERTIAGA
jgi:Transposase DDE domain/Transposase domain (DUF772)